MSDNASPQKRNVDEVAGTAEKPAEDVKRSKADPEAALDKEDDAAEAGPSTGEADADVNEDEVDEDELAALDQDNIITGRRTRGNRVDYTKVEQLPEDDDDDEEDADVTANTTMQKTDDGSSEEEGDEEPVDEDKPEEKAE